MRAFVVDANDGIIAVAGVGEGFLGAGATARAALLAVLTATIAGSIALGGAKYAEAANERDAAQAQIDEEARQLALSPEEELQELAAIYRAKGLSDRLALEVASELSEQNALAAHIDAEHHIDLGSATMRPWIWALAAAAAFATGAGLIVLAVLLSPNHLRPVVVLGTAAVSLVATSFIASRWGQVPVARSVVRTVSVGVIALLVSLATGALLDL